VVVEARMIEAGGVVAAGFMKAAGAGSVDVGWDASLGAVEVAAAGRGRAPVAATGSVGAGVGAGVGWAVVVEAGVLSETGIGLGCCVGLGCGSCKTAIAAGLAGAVAEALAEDRAMMLDDVGSR
jgi:hypothetical protein